jgi:hypothetical protein
VMMTMMMMMIIIWEYKLLQTLHWLEKKYSMVQCVLYMFMHSSVSL